MVEIRYAMGKRVENRGTHYEEDSPKGTISRSDGGTGGSSDLRGFFL